MRHALRMALHSVATRHRWFEGQQIVQILLAGYTAEPLRQMLQSLIGQMRPDNPAEDAIVKDLLNRHQKLCSRRNDVPYGTWIIGYGNEGTTDWSTAIGFKLGKDGKVR